MAIGTSDTVAAHGNHRASIEIAAPPELAFALWSRFDQFPRYFRHVVEVVPHPNRPELQRWKGRVHGIEQEWEAEVTAFAPPRLIAWRSLSGFANSGSLTFERNQADAFAPDGTTTLTVQIGYDPPRGVLGDLAEAVWIKQRFDEGLEEDLTRFKELCEGLFARIQARVADGADQRSAMAEVLRTEAGVELAALDRRIEPADYEMSHIPVPNVITTQELKNRLDWGEPAITILDVRPAALYGESHLRGASSAPLDELEERVREITGRMESGLDRQIIVYSDRDGLSGRAVARLVELGYLYVMDYVDGFSAWRSAGFPTEIQTVGQIAGKGLPERSEYMEEVIAGPTARDHASLGAQQSERADQTPNVRAFGQPAAHLADFSREDTERQFHDEASQENAERTRDARRDDFEPKHKS